MNPKCDKCSEDSIIYQSYSGLHLCKKHFIESVESKVMKYIRKHIDIGNEEKLCVALSGGKDSCVLLYLIDKIFGEWPNLDIISITIDEGIENYRDEAIEYSKSLCEFLDIKQYIYSFKEEIGYSLDEISDVVGKERTCRYCGILRRWLLNKKTKKKNVDKLAVGHNLDDESQSALMNFLSGENFRLNRVAAGPSKKDGFIPRIKPLREVPEKEIGLYAKVKEEVSSHFDECPYSDWALRGDVRDMLNWYEEKHPGTKYSVLRGVDRISKNLTKEENAKLQKCLRCGEPTNNQKCQACKLIENLN
ncbi:MAG: tRNA(Ile)-lysidine synthase TilS/MesJ [Candidatus Methanohalarchaeum thermophilum]|uniref:tRNA(Ile)-lysidine synthase TilS/MesJ n=1 Tax=Methanohalarchaeum thermophilum TaxID=1903181 RepID=A0A1Q6DXF6_METT1|nr:MAG: tRNA(Ile)-lysidine synthase TilS/MesJ [Candidatus Methanohalarchaeum thermophilum]